ncbi:MAG: DMT family transporter [Anaerolineaceae bacterium]|nr:DMT family transporter [Anaerolineaceae bacterium]
MKNKQMTGNLLLLLTAMIWGMAFAFQRKGMESIGPLTFTAVRMGLAAIVIGSAALISRSREEKSHPSITTEDKQIRDKNTLLGGIFCGIFLAAASIFQQFGMVTTSAGKSGFITAMYVLLVPIINFLLFRKRNSLLVWIAVFISVAGMYLLCMTEGFRLAHGDTLLLLCAVMFSGQILCCDHFVQKGDPLGISAIQILTCSAISTAAAFLMEEPSWDQVRAAAIPILYCGIMSGGVGYTLQMIAQKFTDPTIASILMSLESVFAVIGGAILLNERMSGRELLGCILMFFAIILVQLPAPSSKESKS